jgi:phage tail sheath protein FI
VRGERLGDVGAGAVCKLVIEGGFRDGEVMTALLKQAIEAAEKLSDAEQDALATRLLAEIAKEDEFDLALAQTGHKLVGMAEEALAELRAGRTKPIPAERP